MHALKPWIAQPPGILSGDGIDAHTEPAMWPGLQDLNDIGMNSHGIAEKCRVARARQAQFLLIRGQSREVVFVLGMKALKVSLRLFCERRLRVEFFPDLWVGANRVPSFQIVARRVEN